MANLKSSDIMRVKGMGFLINRGTENFSGRIVPDGTVFSAKELETVAKIAETYGNGCITFTARQAAEIVGIPYEKIDDAIKMAEEAGLYFGGTGNKVRPITACKGTTCVYGNYDTQLMAKKIHHNYYIGWSNVKLPHKFKIGIGGCPNSCMKPALNDFGIEGHKPPVFDTEKCKGCKKCAIESACPMKAAELVDGKIKINSAKCNSCGVCSDKCTFDAFMADVKPMYKIYVGGTWGKFSRLGTPLSTLIENEEEIYPLLEKTMLWFKLNAQPKERLGASIDRLGFAKFEADVMGDELLARKDEIINS